MNSCKGCLYRDGVLSAFTCRNPSTPFGQLGLTKVQKDTWKTVWDEENNKYVKVQADHEEWEVDVKFDTMAEYHKFITNPGDNGLHVMTYISNARGIRLPYSNKFIIRKQVILRQPKLVKLTYRYKYQCKVCLNWWYRMIKLGYPTPNKPDKCYKCERREREKTDV